MSSRSRQKKRRDVSSTKEDIDASATEKLQKEPPTKRTKQGASGDRCDPVIRGIHPDALVAQARSPSSRATCVACGKKIARDSPRWGIKYAGNPLSLPVLPLYGTHPMYMWCHAGCGLAYCRLAKNSEGAENDAMHTCHMCEASPNLAQDKGLRLLCGGPDKNRKIQSHAFHLRCWRRAMEAVKDDSCRRTLLVSCHNIGNKQGMFWEDLTEEEKAVAQKALNY